MVLIAALALAISGREGGLAQALPILGAVALGAQRLLPLRDQWHAGTRELVLPGDDGHRGDVGEDARLAGREVDGRRVDDRHPPDRVAAEQRGRPPGEEGLDGGLTLHHRVRGRPLRLRGAR